MSETATLWQGWEKHTVAPGDEPLHRELRKIMAPMLGHAVVLLAMKSRRAPLPVSSALWKGLLRRGLPNDLEELERVAQRYMFLGDERMLLAELKLWQSAGRVDSAGSPGNFENTEPIEEQV